ncbi:MAG TPA: helix-turn-helix domain-containing protein [Pyrinomonadaceae bacterium]|jgi:excisionase family DNA binding protein|nr:helix-turn-helix domain-containing protein [Pyrinomonadaceae bacterium]
MRNNRQLVEEDQTGRDEFLTTRQLSSILQVSETTIRRLAQTGRIPAVRLTPRLTRYHLPAVREALNGTHASRKPSTGRPGEQIEERQLSFTDLL